MAGIGFRLQKLLASESYSSLVRAYLYSAIIASGPLLVVVFLLAIVKTFIQSRLGYDEATLFQGIIVYSFAFSLLGTGPILYVVTRYLADKYYLKQMETFTPTYLSTLLIVFVVQSLAALPLLRILEIPFNAKWAVLCLYLSINGIWIAMIFLSAAKSYLWIVMAFGLGSAVGVTASLLLGTTGGLSGFLFGYTLGQVLTFLLLTARIISEFGYSFPYDFGVAGYFRKYPYLVLVGLFYYLGLWIDKMIFWYSAEGQRVGAGIYLFSDYDTPMFLAFLTIVPSMAFFLIQMETSFAQRYAAYYRGVRNRAPLGKLLQRKSELMENLTLNFQKYVIFQGFFSSLAIFFIYRIAEGFHLDPYQMGVFRIGILGAFLQMGFMMILNIFFYFDFQKEVFWVTFVYFFFNTIFTLASRKIGLPAYGFGYTAAGFVTVVFAFVLLNKRLKNLDYWTFMRQPILIPRFKLEKEAVPHPL